MNHDRRTMQREAQELPTVITLVSDQPQPVLVVGGTRGTGLLIARLLRDRDMPVRVLARDAVAASARLGSAIEVMSGDITNPETLPQAVANAAHIIFTAGVRSGHLAGEAQVRGTDYQGVVNTLTAARSAGFKGRFLYLTTMGVKTPSVSGWLLNLIKRNVLHWRLRAEEAVRASGLDYTIVRTGFLVNGAAGVRAVAVTQDALPLSPSHRIARADVAESFLNALRHPNAARTTYEVAWKRAGARESWDVLLSRLQPDVPS